MRHVSDSEEYPTGPNQDAGFPSGSREVDAFCVSLGLTSQLDPNRIEALAAELAVVASATAPPNQHGVELGRRRRPLLPRWRRRAALTTLMSSIAAKVVFATVAVATTTGGLAATGSLPDPAQQVVSDVASRIGIHIPEPIPSGLGSELLEELMPSDDTSGHGPPGNQPAGSARVTREIGTNDSLETTTSETPTLPEAASDQAKWVLTLMSDPDDTAHRSEIGKRIAEAASSRHSQAGARSQGNQGNGPPDGVGGGPPQSP
jgi:flagellar motor protein MotB